MAAITLPRRALMVMGVYAAAAYVCVCVAAPYQELEPRSGYVPVYIRLGNTPLHEIHPDLAYAFHELESSNLMLQDATNQPPDQLSGTLESQIKEATVAGKVAQKQDEHGSNTSSTTTATPQNVQHTQAVPAAPETDTKSDIASFDVVQGDTEKNAKRK